MQFVHRNSRRPDRCVAPVALVQMEDSLLLDGKLKEYQSAFQAVDISGNGTLGEYIFQAVNAKLHEQILH